jgi:hypothetical protein
MKSFIPILILLALLGAWLLPSLLGSLSMRSVAADFVAGLRTGLCTANSAALHAPGMRSANAAAVRAILVGSIMPAYNANDTPRHGMITTANASLFSEAFFSEPNTIYALGWPDPHGYDAAAEFLAPPLDGITGQLYEHIEYPNSEAFLSDDLVDDLRPIGGDFKTVDYSQSKNRREIPNRGLRIVLDWDRIRTRPTWQQHYTGLLMSRLKRNAWRRKVALALAAGTPVSIVWDPAGAADPDLDLANQAKLAGDASGINPNRVLWGQAARLLRYATYGATNTAKAMAGRSLSAEEASAKVGLAAMVDESRYQTGATKTSIVGSKLVLFNAYSTSGEDPSNFKSAIGATSQGGRYAVYVRQLSVKFWEIVVECYETEFCATTLGCRTLTVSAS